jgi:hypothetical protein
MGRHPRPALDGLAAAVRASPKKAKTPAGERFLQDRYVARDEGHRLLCAVGGFRRAADSMGLRINTVRSMTEARPGLR